MTLVSIAVWIVLALVGGGLLCMILFGIRSMMAGKISPFSIVIITVPIVLLLVMGLVIGNWAVAAIYTLLILLALALITLLVTGLKGLFS